MVGIEPARERVEIYLRLPQTPLDGLRPMLRAAEHPQALEVLNRGLPDGLRRLVGRRLGISFAVAAGGPRVDVALFASARKLFPGAPAALARLVPEVAGVPASLGRATLVTIGLDGERDRLSFAVGMTVASGGSRVTVDESL